MSIRRTVVRSGIALAVALSTVLADLHAQIQDPPAAKCPERISFEVERNDPQYVHYFELPVPPSERAFTHDVRRIEMQGRILRKPVVVTPFNAAELDELYKPLSEYLALARKADISGINNLFDSEDQKKIGKIFTEDMNRRSAEAMASIDAYEFHLLIREDPYIFAYGYIYRGSKRQRWMATFKYSGGRYHMAGGLASVSTSWRTVLGVALQERGFDAVEQLVRRSQP